MKEPKPFRGWAVFTAAGHCLVWMCDSSAHMSWARFAAKDRAYGKL